MGTRESREEELMEQKCELNKDQKDKKEQVLPISGNFPGKRKRKNRCPEVGTHRAHEQNGTDPTTGSGTAKGGKEEGIGSYGKDCS